jgi:hypothetical protein
MVDWNNVGSQMSTTITRRGVTRRGWRAAIRGSVALAFCFVSIAVAACGTSDQVVLKSRVQLVPSANAGWTGWCVLVVGERGATCAASKVSSTVVAQVWTGNGPPPAALGYGVFAARVTKVAVHGGAVFSTRDEAGLPDGLRVAAVELPGTNLLKLHQPLTFASYGVHGERLHTASQNYLLGQQLPTRVESANSACRIGTSGLPGLAPGQGRVLRKIVPTRQLLGSAFITCASRSYTLHGWPMLASILLNASQPGSEPGSLPALHPASGDPGSFIALGSEGPTAARRVPGAWLTVSRGKSDAQRLEMLDHLFVVGSVKPR